MKRIVWSVLGMCLAVPVAAQQPPRGARPVPQQNLPTTLKMLEQRVPEVSFADVPFEQVVEWIADFTGANVNVRWSALESSGIERDKRVSMKMRNIKLSQVLWLLMNEVGGSDVKLAYRASGNLIILSTHEDLGKDMVVRAYDVSDLLVRIPRFTNAANLNPAQALNQAGQSGQGGGGGSSQIFDEQENEQSNRDAENQQGGARTADMQQLIQLITDVVEPDSWVTAGGQGTITSIRNTLVVRNTILVHQQLAGFVEDVEGP